MGKGNTPRPIRFDDGQWFAALAAFPAERGRKGGLSAEVQSFVEFLAEDPQDWKNIKRIAEDRGVEPWDVVREMVRKPQP